MKPSVDQDSNQQIFEERQRNGCLGCLSIIVVIIIGNLFLTSPEIAFPLLALIITLLIVISSIMLRMRQEKMEKKISKEYRAYLKSMRGKANLKSYEEFKQEREQQQKDEPLSNTNKGDNQQEEQYHRWREEHNRRSSQTWESQSEEHKHESALGLNGQVTASEVKKAYREMLAKYHPDKVDHLGDEFKQIADQKTREIIAAYKFFCKKYNIT